MSLIGNVWLPLINKHAMNTLTARSRGQLVIVFHPTAASCRGFISSPPNSGFIHKMRAIALANSSIFFGNDIDIHCHHRRMSMFTTSNPSSLKHNIQKKGTLLDPWRKESHLNLNMKSDVASAPKTDLQSPDKQNCDIKSRLSEGEAEDAVADVCKRIIFRNDNIVAINKPFGMSVFGSSVKQLEKSEDGSAVSSNKVPIVRILPQLKNKINRPELDIGLSLKSFYSGLVILCTHKKSASRLKKVIAESHAQKIQLMTYLAITVGVPQCPFGENLTANIKREWLHNREMSVISDTKIHSACKEGSMIQTCFNITPLVVNTSLGAALIQVTINKDKWGAVEALLSHYLSPVLSDHIYSSRTNLVAGVPCPASAQAAMPGIQRLPSAIKEILQSSTEFTEETAPLFVHRYKVALHKFPNRLSKPLVITAPPQKEFLAALNCLGLNQEGKFS